MSCAPWPPPKRRKPLIVFLPSTIIENEPGLLMKTIRAGEIARILSIYRVNELALFRGKGGKKEGLELSYFLLQYTVTPPHLKKIAFPLDERLRYAGMIKPLQTPAHNPPDRLENGTVIDGIIEKCLGQYCVVNLGRLGSVRVKVGPYHFKPGNIVTIKIRKTGNRTAGELYETKYYWNLKVKKIKNVKYVLKELKREGYAVIGTSRLGKCVYNSLKDLIDRSKGTILFIGGPKTHVWDEAPIDLFDIIVNTVPVQGTKTVRAHEALLASLAVIESIL